MLAAPPDTGPDAAHRPAAASSRVGEHRGVDLINLGGPSTEALLTRVAANIGDAVAAVEAFWGTDWSPRVTVTATGSAAQFAALAGGAIGGGSTVPWSDVAAVAVADRVDTERRIVIGQQVVLAPGAAAMSTPALRIVLTHELFHYAARVDTAADAPRWLTEGVADFVARPAPPSARVGVSPQLPTDADLAAPGPGRDLAYDRAWLFARFVAAHYGPDRLRELYLAACGPGHPDAPTAIRRVLGAGLPDVLAGWQRWLAGGQPITSAG